MKKYFTLVPVLLFLYLLTSCGGQNNNSENQSVNPPNVQEDSSSSAQTETTDGAGEKRKHHEHQKSEHQGIDSLLGSRIIDRMVERLTEKLNLKGEQSNSVREILKGTFSEAGLDMNQIYTVDQSKEIRKDLLNKSHESIANILDPGQKEKFEKTGRR